MYGKHVGADPHLSPHSTKRIFILPAACCAVAISVGTWLHWRQPMSSLENCGCWGLAWLLSLLVWKRCWCDVGKSYKVTGCCWRLVRAPAMLCCGIHTVENCQTQHQHQGRNNRAYFSSGWGYFGVSSPLLCSSECCLAMCKLWGETGVNRPGSVLE